MPGRAQLIALAGAGYLLLTRDGRARVSKAVGALRSSSKVRGATGPKAVEPYAPVLVDRRHLSETAAAAQPGHGTTATEVAVEFYEENPPA